MRISRHFTAGMLALSLALAGCSAATTAAPTSTSVTSSASGTTSSGASSSDGASASRGASASGGASATAPTAEAISASIADATHFDDDDLIWDAAEEVTVTLADGASSAASGVTVDGDTVTITAAGTYRLTGALSDGQLVVAAADTDVVRVILDGVTLASSSGSPFVVQAADEVLVYLADGSTNTLTDADSYADQSDDAPNAALYSMADLTIAGPGSLTVNGNFNDGIVSKDGLVLAGGTVSVTAVDDGIRGKDYLVLLDGAYTVTAGDDGVKSDNDEDSTRGWLTIYGGALTVSAGDDGVKAETTLTVAGGSVTVTESAEGFEAQHISISGGTSDVSSSDDGVNASGGGASSGGGESVGDYSVDVSGGVLTINSQGDGLDSNGTATISGGTVVINGPTNDGNGALDVNGGLVVTGGTVAAAGSAGMAVTPGTDSTQSGVQVTFGSTIAAGTVIQLADSAGTVVATFVTTKATASLVFSSAAVVAGEPYTVYTGGTADVSAGLGTGTLDGAAQVTSVTAGQYTAGRGGGRGPR